MISSLAIIQGWQEIGRHIGRSGRTTRRWFDNYKMPIRYGLSGRPFAFIYELHIWMAKVNDLVVPEKLSTN